MLTLRAEGTAPVCRAYLEHGMHNLSQPVRLHYFCPVFRYERPQAGRYRQHHQFGIEALGDASAHVDAEVIEFGWRLLDAAGVEEKFLLLNTTGDRECRPAYVERLQAHYRPQYDRLCENCKRRLEENPLRLLDCKEEPCQPIIAEAPHSIDFLCGACEEHWKALLTNMEAIGLEFRIDHTLVRGFDYYTRTVFEIVPPGAGSQSTLLGGGRYDGLIEELGGRPTPGVGFGLGIERVLANVTRDDDEGSTGERDVKVVVAALGAEVRGRWHRALIEATTQQCIRDHGPIGPEPQESTALRVVDSRYPRSDHRGPRAGEGHGHPQGPGQERPARGWPGRAPTASESPGERQQLGPLHHNPLRRALAALRSPSADRQFQSLWVAGIASGPTVTWCIADRLLLSPNPPREGVGLAS